MNFEYIIVQAGGKGTRMGYLTANKPKCLVPVENLPMLFHLFTKYPKKRFVIIGDYKYDVLKSYLHVFAQVKYLLIDARGKKGTCAGIKEAMDKIPSGTPFMLIWSDLILQENFEIPDMINNYIGLSGDFRCRWKYERGKFKEKPSIEYGVAGLFIFKSKSELKELPSEGEFVKWLENTNKNFRIITLSKTKEYGLIEEYSKLEISRCRPFNKIKVTEDRIIKEGVNEQGRNLAIREKAWYRHIINLNITFIPKIYSFDPFSMEKVNGKNIYEYNFTFEEKSIVLKKIVEMLKLLHAAEKIEKDSFSIKEAYFTKTFARLNLIRDLIPFADEKYILINGRKCRNVFFFKDLLEQKINELPVKEFGLLHGDCTFSNMMLKENKEPVMIDPRGYFGFTELYGDIAYDWAKLYYSIVGNYDQFNLKNFILTIKEDSVSLKIKSNGWESMEGLFFELLEDEIDEFQIKIIHAVIWLSFTVYAWEDYDSICGAFYNGLYYLEELL